MISLYSNSLIDSWTINERDYIYRAKAYAVFSVIMSHTLVDMKYGNRFDYYFIGAARAFSCIGVIMFFILAGYFFQRNKYSLSLFWKNRIKNFITPWFITGYFIYYISSFYGNDTHVMSLKGYMNFILGWGSYFYYMTILLSFYIIFFFLRNKNLLVISTITMIITLISIFITELQVFDLMTQFRYLNIFNWIFFFSLGMLIAQRDLLNTIIIECRNYSYIIFGLFIIGIIASVKMFGNNVSYFHVFMIMVELLGCLSIFSLSFNAGILNNPLRKIGKLSFSIYLLHMPLAGAINIIFSKVPALIGVIVKPVMVTLLMYLLIEVGQIFSRRIGVESLFIKLFGIRG